MEWAWLGLAVVFLLVLMLGVGHLGRIADSLHADRRRRDTNTSSTRRP